MGIFSRSTPEYETIKSDLQEQSRRVREVLAEVQALETEIRARFREMDERADRHERTVRAMAEELDERIDRGNKIWRKIRASEYYEASRDNGEEDEGPNFEFPGLDGAGGEEPELLQVPTGLGWPGRPPSKAQEVGKALARRIAGLE